METKRIITGIIAVMVFAGLIACPALARKYDTMMVGPDRWIDSEYLEVHCQKSNGLVFNESSNKKPEEIASSEGYDDEENIITYDGQLEPNTVTLVYYPAEHPEHPNDTTFEGELEPNLATLYYQRDEHPVEPNFIDYEEEIDPNLMFIFQQSEHPEHPNSIDYKDIELNQVFIYVNSEHPEHPEHPNSIDYEDIEPDQVHIYLKAEHPEHPNDVSADEEIDPNDIDKIILDEGTAKVKAAKPDITRSS